MQNAIQSRVEKPLLSSQFPLLGVPRQGKVRDIYDLGQFLLLVATDRISAFDVVLPDGIPGKGYVLTQLSRFWFDWFSGRGISHHFVTDDVDRFPENCRPYRALLAGRSLLVRKAAPLPVECIVRGYMAGSGWKEYRKTGAIAGEVLPPGLRSSSRLPTPIFTPSTKAPVGEHDQAISFHEMESLCGVALARTVRDISLSIYQDASAHAESVGLVIADTKMEFGLDPETGAPMVIDELLTPDSSRFWPEATPDRPQVSFDKQFVRDYLLLHWDGTGPPPPLPAEIIQQTSQKYFEALERLTGMAPGVHPCPSPR